MEFGELIVCYILMCSAWVTPWSCPSRWWWATRSSSRSTPSSLTASSSPPTTPAFRSKGVVLVRTPPPPPRGREENQSLTLTLPFWKTLPLCVFSFGDYISFLFWPKARAVSESGSKFLLSDNSFYVLNSHFSVFLTVPVPNCFPLIFQFGFLTLRY